MTREKITEIMSDITNVMSKYKKDGLDFSMLVKNSFDGLKVEVTIKSVEDDMLNKRLSLNYGFTQNIVGMNFVSSHKTHKIVGFKSQNRKYPIITTNLSNGKSYKFSVNDVKRNLGGDKLINRSANLEKLTYEEN